MQFYTLLTNTGLAKITNAQASGTTVNLTQLAVGDGGGQYYDPTETQTALVNEVWRGILNQVKVDEDNENWLIIETVIPAANGGFTIREAGVYDDEGDLIAVAKYPQTYKPNLEEGSAKDLYIRMILEISNASVVTLKINPAVVLASRAYVDIALQRLYPVGSVYINAAVATNPATLLGFGTWEAFGAGRVLVGVDEWQAEFSSLGKTGGEKTHQLTVDEMPEHRHQILFRDSNHFGDSAGTANESNVKFLQNTSGSETNTTYVGANQAHNNLQPYITVYMWKRVG